MNGNMSGSEGDSGEDDLDVDNTSAGRKRFIPRCIPDSIFDQMVNILNNRKVCVSKRDKVYQCAKMRLYRGKGKYTLNGKGELCFENRVVLNEGRIKKQTSKKIDESKGGGASIINKQLKEEFVGISRRKVREVIQRHKTMQHINAKFKNRPIHRPISATYVHGRHQIDLVDFSKDRVHFAGQRYRYILSLMDVFSRYVWLKPLTNKRSSSVASILQMLYEEHGYPTIIQTDNGGEFRGEVDTLCKRHNIKHVRSRPYNPRAQGKVERMHKTLKRLYMYDLLTESSTNWVKSLPAYAKIINNKPKESLSWLTPYQVFFGRKRGGDVQRSYSGITKVTMQLHERVRDATKNYARAYVRKQFASRTCPVYNRGQKLLHKFKQNAKYGVSVAHKVITVKVIDRNVRTSRYRIRYRNPTTQSKENKWVCVSELADYRGKNKTSNNSAHRRKFLIRLPSVKKAFARRTNIYISYDPPGDGSCLFGSVAHQLQSLGIYRSSAVLRAEVVDFMLKHPTFCDGTHLQQFLPNDNWLTYLSRLRLRSTWADNYEIMAIAELFNVRIQIISSLGQPYDRTIVPTSSVPISTIYLGHYGDNGGLHFVSLKTLQDEPQVQAMSSPDRTPAGSDVASQSPVGSPVASPVGSPVESPIVSPVASLVGSPVESPIVSPVPSLVGSPVESPVASPVPSLVGSPVESPVASPVGSPVESPVESPVASPVASPVGSPVESPIVSPVPSPVGSPVESPVASPVASLVGSPVESPVASPVPSPVGSPVESPVAVPVASTVGSPVASLDRSPVESPLGSSVASHVIPNAGSIVGSPIASSVASSISSSVASPVASTLRIDPYVGVFEVLSDLSEHLSFGSVSDQYGQSLNLALDFQHTPGLLVETVRSDNGDLGPEFAFGFSSPDLQLTDLPNEILTHIVRQVCEHDLTFIGLFNRINRRFREIASSFYPSIHVNEAIIEKCKDIKDVSIKSLCNYAGKGSGLLAALKEFFGGNRRWLFGWIQLRRRGGFNWYTIVDYYWRPSLKKK